ncbi:SgcJ/EcaC family oxidoreductase [Tsukamurella sp. 1534]|uniref:SgcJ/EcaC family oxidoreductase n=1 Tax=Tsukamurella sp. 1534 TaxID=1151061 RepID=UPI00031CEFE0|nr:SgcJ/EcaC family oxidoreductase [Tsukamurella sp. 1534]
MTAARPVRGIATAAVCCGLLAVAACGTAGDGPRAPQSAPSAPQRPDGAVRALVDRFTAAWNAGDGRAFGDTYAPDAVHVTFQGAALNGREEITRTHAELFGTFLRGSRIDLNLTSIRFLDETVAVVYGTGGILESGDTAITPDRLSANTMVASEHDGRWLLDAVQVTRIEPSGPPR